jgi:hypothetical protein
MIHGNEKHSMPPKRRLPATVHVANATSRLRADHFDEEAIAVARFEDSASTSLGAVVLAGRSPCRAQVARVLPCADLPRLGIWPCGSHANALTVRASCQALPRHFVF